MRRHRLGERDGRPLRSHSGCFETGGGIARGGPQHRARAAGRPVSNNCPMALSGMPRPAPNICRWFIRWCAPILLRARKYLYVNPNFTDRIKGFSRRESDALLTLLFGISIGQKSECSCVGRSTPSRSGTIARPSTTGSMSIPRQTPDAPRHLRRRQGVLSRIAAAQEGAGCGHSLFAVESARPPAPSPSFSFPPPFPSRPSPSPPSTHPPPPSLAAALPSRALARTPAAKRRFSAVAGDRCLRWAFRSASAGAGDDRSLRSLALWSLRDREPALLAQPRCLQPKTAFSPFPSS